VFGTDPLDELSIPDGTHVKEHDLATDGDVLVGGQSTVELGIQGGTVVAGERVTVEGDIEADGDCRLDMWCDIEGNVLVGSDAYLGERVHIAGQLIVSGDLDIGDDVEIEEGFEANGWIVIRNPMPTIVFLFVYLSHLLRVGEKEAAAEVASEFLTDDREAEPVVIPRGGRVSDDSWRVSTPATIGDDCRLHGNIRATEIEVGSDTEVFGSLRAKGPIRVGNRTTVHGDVTTRGGDVTVGPDAHIRGDISCERCELSEAAEVEGTIRAREGITLEDTPAAEATPAEDPVSPDGEATDREPDLPPAIVPIEEGQLPASKSDSAATGESAETGEARDTEEPATTETDTRAFVPLDSSEADRAIVPIEQSDIEWDSVGTNRTNGAGSDEDISTIITDAENR
jgi:predicted acyltransferase (DUF342 family)